MPFWFSFGTTISLAATWLYTVVVYIRRASLDGVLFVDDIVCVHALH